MSEHTFFLKGRNKGNERQIVLRTATLLVGKAPTKQKRIKMKVSMPLTGKKTSGMPEWITNAMTFVMQSHDTVVPDLEFKGFDIHFDDQQLFDSKGAKAPKCQMRGFVVEEVGDSSNPDVDLTFLIYAPFSTRLWNWCGQMGGEEFWAQFTQVEEPQSDTLELSGESDEEENDPEDVEGE